MVWSCTLCTFDNSNDNALKCEICETLKNGESIISSSSPIKQSDFNHDYMKKQSSLKPSVQGTLFGGIAKIPEKKTTTKSTTSKNNNTLTTADNSKALSKILTNNNIQNEKPVVKLSTKQDTTILSFTKIQSSLNIYNDNINTKNLTFSELKKRAKDIMKNIFNIDKLRFLQPLAITCGLKRQSQIVVMATGGGKSLCYQLPALVLGGTSIIISPLIALMQDQVQALIEKNISAAVISSNNGEKHNLDIMERLLGRSLRVTKKSSVSSGPFKPITLLYVTPEQVQTNRFRDMLREINDKQQLTMFAVDEAHCLSSWGHDFRKSYMQLDYLREKYPDIPLMACTATATPEVLKDIKKVLHLDNSPCHIGSFDRPNIFYRVKYKDSLDITNPGGAIADLLTFIKKQHKRADDKSVPCTGIIYVHTRQETSEIATTISKQCGIVAVSYHGGLKVAERNEAQEAWTSGKAKIAVATVAFGMGIDLAHVRYVVHWTISKNIESFYQESGRAGRDGLPSFSIVYFSKDDVRKFEFLLRNQKKSKDGKNELPVRDIAALEEIVDYCTVPGCRRYRLLKHFGQKIENPNQICNKTCDYCVNPDRVKRSMESASSAKDFSFHTRVMQPTHKSKKRFNPYDDDEDGFDAAWSVGGLGVTEAGMSIDDDGIDHSDSKPKANFVKASSILSKYEAIESKGGKGFVNFKQKKRYNDEEVEKRDNTVRIPKHFISVITNNSGPKITKEIPIVKTSTDYAAEAERLRAQLEKAKAAALLLKKDTNQLSSNVTSMKRSPPVAPPSLNFETSTKRKK